MELEELLNTNSCPFVRREAQGDLLIPPENVLEIERIELIGYEKLGKRLSRALCVAEVHSNHAHHHSGGKSSFAEA
jgi:hypothetical protein